MRVPSSTPGGMLTDKVFSRRVRPWPPQALHGVSMTRPAPWHAAQVRSIVKKPCWARTRPRPWQVGQAIGREPASAAAAFALVAGDQRLNADRRLLAAERFFERDLEVVAKIAAAARAALAAPAAAHELAEHLVEDVGKAAGKAEIARAAAAPLLKGGMSEAIIGGALLIVLQDVIGLADFLEFLFGALVPGLRSGWCFIASLR